MSLLARKLKETCLELQKTIKTKIVKNTENAEIDEVNVKYIPVLTLVLTCSYDATTPV